MLFLRYCPKGNPSGCGQDWQGLLPPLVDEGRAFVGAKVANVGEWLACRW